MANPVSPNDGSGFRLGYVMKKVSTTLTACLTRAYANATTSGATDVAHIGIATHVEDDAAVLADATATPLVLIGGKRGSHVTVGTAGDVGAIQVDVNGGLLTLGHLQATLLASAARTTTQTGADTTNHGARGVKVTVDMTVVGTGSITVAIEEKDPTSGKYTAILTSAAIVTNVVTILTVYPGLTAVANVTASQVLPRDWRIVVTANNANSATYSVGYCLLV